MDIKQEILKLWEKESFDKTDRSVFEEFKTGLNQGAIRAAERTGSEWKVNLWVK